MHMRTYTKRLNTQTTAVMDAPPEQSKARDRHNICLHSEQHPNSTRMHKLKGELDEPKEEEGEQSPRVGSTARWQGVRNAVVPTTAKDTSQRHREKFSAIETLHAVPDDADDCSKCDEEVRTVHAEDSARKDGVTNVVGRAWTGHAQRDKRGEDVGDDGGAESLTPGQADCDQSCAVTPLIGVEGCLVSLNLVSCCLECRRLLIS